MSKKPDHIAVNFVTEAEPGDDTLSLIRSRLREYNEKRVGPYSAQKFALLAYGEESRFLGGMFGWLQWDWLVIDWAWVDPETRRQGVGTALLQRFESLALAHGIHRSRLNTASFQEGLSFYKRNGYEIFAELEIRSPNGDEHKDYFLRKALSDQLISGPFPVSVRAVVA